MEFIEVSKTLRLRPFMVPNFVLSVEPVGEGHVYPIGAISTEALELLCDHFRRDLLARAKQQAEDQHRV